MGSKSPFASHPSLYHNYRGFFFIIILDLVDTDYKFVWMEVGSMGHM